MAVDEAYDTMSAAAQPVRGACGCMSSPVMWCDVCCWQQHMSFSGCMGWRWLGSPRACSLLAVRSAKHTCIVCIGLPVFGHLTSW